MVLTKTLLLKHYYRRQGVLSASSEVISKSSFKRIPLSPQALPTGKILSELFPAILDRIITRKDSKRINLTVIRVHYRNHLADHRSHDTRTEIPWTNSCNELPDDNPPTINSVIFDRNMTGEKSQQFGTKREHKPKLLSLDIFRWGIGVFHVKGWGPKSSICPSKPGKSNVFGGIARQNPRKFPTN